MQTDNVIPPHDTSAEEPLFPLPNLQLGISTRLPLHQGFLDDPMHSALKRGVHRVAPPAVSTTFSTDPDTREKIAKKWMNIHFINWDAIRVFACAERPGGPMTINTVHSDVALLIYGDSDHPLAHDDVARALTRVQEEIAPLLAYEDDAEHIVPGVARRSEARASWRYITSTVTYMHTPLHECYNIAHPGTGAAEGATPKMKKLGKKGDDLIITFESVKVPLHDEQTGTIGDVPGIRVAVSLKGHGVVCRYRDNGRTARIGENLRLTRFAPLAPAAVHDAIMSELEGVYVAPSDRPETGRANTPAKAIAFFSAITPLSAEDLSSAFEEIASPSESKRKRLKSKLPKELALIQPVPLSTRLTAEFQAPSSAKPLSRSVGEVDSRIAAIYG